MIKPLYCYSIAVFLFLVKRNLMRSLIKNYISQIEEIQFGKPWVGNSYSEILKTLNNDGFFVKPFKGMHSIAEIISHCTMWRNEAILKIETGTGTKTDDSEENWLLNSVLIKKGWDCIYDEYLSSHEKYIQVLSRKEDKFLTTTYYDIDFKKEYTYKFLVDGILHHDIYHLGQIGLIRKFIEIN